MAIIKCPECGQDVSDKANVCIHCGAPLNFSAENGVVKIKCCNIDGNPYKVKVVNLSNGAELAKIAQGGVASFEIDADTEVEFKYPLLKAVRVKIPYKGKHFYQIVMANSFLWPKIQVNEVTNIDSD